MSVDKLPSGKWRSRIKVGKRVIATRTFLDKADAVEWDYVQKRLLDNHKWVDPKSTRKPIDKLVSQFVLHRKLRVSPQTHATEESLLRLHFVRAFGPRPLVHVQAFEILDLLVDTMARTSRPTAIRLRGVLILFYDYAISLRLLTDNHPRNLKMPRGRDQHPYRNRQIRNLDAILTTLQGINPGYADIVEFLSLTGLRWGELKGLRVSNVVSEPRPSVLVSSSKSDGFAEKRPKNGRTRRVPLSKRGFELAKRYQLGKKQTDRLFTSARGGELNGSNFRKALCWDDTVPGHRIHDLRHTAGTNWIVRGIHIEVVSRWLGHSSTRVTQDIYVDVLGMVGEAESVTKLD